MLYVFCMKSGSFWSFDNRFVAESVAVLCSEIERTYQILASRQILIASGGERLLPERRVSSYNVGGTDTNPIFLFENSAEGVGYSAEEAEDSETSNREFDLEARVKDNLNLPAAYDTVQKRMQLAAELDDWSHTEITKCDALVREQLMLHQGWSAAVAHVDEFAAGLKTTYARFSELCVELLAAGKREQFAAMLQRFSARTELFKRMPLVSFLRERYGYSPSEPNELPSQATLLHLVSGEAEQDQASLYELEKRAELLLDTVARDGDEQVDDVGRNYSAILRQLALGELREIRGVSRRLREVQAVLDDVRVQASSVRTGRQALAADFDRLRAAPPSVRDRGERGGVLAELCTSHRTLLPKLWDAATRAAAKRRLCARAKHELRSIIFTAFGRLAGLHAHAANFQRQLTLRSENLARLATIRSIVAQLDAAPSLYIAALSEMQRRREISSVYRQIWSQAHAQLRAVYEPDMRLRNRFVNRLRAHFLKHVFSDYDLERLLPEPPAVPIGIDVALPEFLDEDNELLERLTTILSEANAMDVDPDTASLQIEDATDKAALVTAAASVSEPTQRVGDVLQMPPQNHVCKQTQTEDCNSSLESSAEQQPVAQQSDDDIDSLQRQLDSMRTQLDGLYSRMRANASEAPSGEQLRSAVTNLRRLVDQCVACCSNVEVREGSLDRGSERPEAEAREQGDKHEHEHEHDRIVVDQERSVLTVRDDETHAALAGDSALDVQQQQQQQQQQQAIKEEAGKKLVQACDEQLLVNCLLAIRVFIFSGAVPVGHSLTSLIVNSIAQLGASRLQLREPDLWDTENLSSTRLASMVSLSRCVSGELVLVYYSEQYASYMLFNLMPLLHFVHADSLVTLELPALTGTSTSGANRAQSTDAAPSSGLSPEDDFAGTRYWSLALVTKKELCVVKKRRNRFGLPLNSKFYHVRVQPLTVAGVKQVLSHADAGIYEETPGKAREEAVTAARQDLENDPEADNTHAPLAAEAEEENQAAAPTALVN